MPLRPVDRDALADVARTIAQDSFGFVYVDAERDRLRDRYEAQEKSVLKASSPSTSQLKEALQSIAEDETFAFERIRSGVYYRDPFGRGEAGIKEKLEDVFRDRIVVTTEDLREAFNISHDDAGFFASELRGRELVERISAGNREYYIVGKKLREHLGGGDLDDKLRRRSIHGKISHDQLEDAISVAATSDVISYLQSEGYIVDMDGEYLVRAALSEFARHIASEIEDDIVAAFDDAGYLLPEREYESLLSDEIEARTPVLSAARSTRGDTSESDVLSAVREEFASKDAPQIETLERTDLAVHRDPFDEQIEAQAEELTRPVLADTTANTPSSMLEEIESDIEDLRLATTEAGNGYARDRVRDRAEELIQENF
ncbi:MAG: hypothetical protein ABEJ79_06530 [Halolamina sp.]